MPLVPKNRIVININEAILLLLSITYAGISSDIFFGFRVVDFLVVAFFVIKLRKRMDPWLAIIFALWIVSIAFSTIVGIWSMAPFIASDLRYFLVLILAAYIGYSIGEKFNINVERLFYRLMGLTFLVYCAIPFFDFLRFYYIPESFQKDEHVNTVFGPSTILINYLFVYLVLVNKNRKFWFYASYLIFAILIYNFRISRSDLALMLMLFAWSLIYRLGDRIKAKHVIWTFILLLAVGIGFYFNDSERINGLLKPGQDTSFVYRILTNNEFLRQFWEASIIHKIFGFGIGATLYTHLSEWLGVIILTILDNGPLTVMMKTGLLGLLGYILVFVYPLRGFSIKRKLIIVFPVLLSMALFSHTIYNLLYVLGFYLISFGLKSKQTLYT